MPDGFFDALPQGEGFNFDQLLIWLQSQTISFQKIITGSLQAGNVLESANFVSGTSGWQIDGDGNAEFNNVTVRGDIVSGNWDGGFPATVPDTGATAGFYLDESNGSAQFEGSIYAEGTLYTSSNPSGGGRHIRVNPGTAQRVGFYNNNTLEGFLENITGGIMELHGNDSVLISSDANITLGVQPGSDLYIERDAGSGDFPQIFVPAGSASLPTIARSDTGASDPDTGIYWPGADIIGFAAQGNEQMRIGKARVELQKDLRLQTAEYIEWNNSNNRIGFNTNGPGNHLHFQEGGTTVFRMLDAGNSQSRLYGNETNDWMEIDGNNEFFQFYLNNTEYFRILKSSSSALQARDGLTDVGNHETLRLNRGTGSTMKPIGYYSSWLDTKTDIKGLDDPRNPWWKREWFMDLDPISSRKKKDRAPFRGGEDMRTISFYMENLIENTNLLTTKGIRVGDSPDEHAILAVTVDYVQHLEHRVRALEERLAA